MTDVARPARVMRTLARIVTAMAAVEGLICLYVLRFGGIRIDAGPLRVSAGTWRHPFTQGIVLALLAAWLYWRDAIRQGEWDVVPRLVRRLASRVIVAATKTEALLWAGVSVATVAAVIVCYLVAAKAFVVGSIEGGWAYPYLRDIPTRTAAIVLVGSVSIAAAVRWLTDPRGARSEWAVIIAWLAIATAGQAALRSLAPFGLEQILTSSGANSFYTVTQQYGADSVLTRFTELRNQWPVHAGSNMPGKLLLLYGLELISNDPRVLSWLLLAVSNIGGLLLYLLVRDLFGDRQVALYALVLYFFVPAKLFFLPLMNTVTPVVAFACLLLFERWVQRAGLGYGIAAAASLYTLVFFEPVPLVIGALVALILARALMRGDIPLKTLMIQSLWGIAVFLGMIVLAWLRFNFNLADAFRRVAADAAAFNALEHRPYGLWVRRNLVEFAFGVGVCQAVLFWFALADGLLQRADSWLNRPIVLFSTALLVMLLALDLAGFNRGEVIRLWIFLACLFQVPAAYVCVRLRSRAAFAVVLMLTIVQAAVATASIGFVIP